jgi:hypothetical protein
LAELGIELILANSPQAKGRVERLFGTLQDRWVKELRLARVSTLAAANALLETKLLPHFNRWFTVKPASPNDAHRPLAPTHDLAAILSLQHTRTVANDYTVRFANVVYQLRPPAWPGLRGSRIILQERADGSLRMRFRQRYLPFQRARTTSVPEKEAEKQQDETLGGSAPQTPQSLTLSGCPAEGKGRTATEARPSAGTTAARRSGRTPALPYPPGRRMNRSRRPLPIQHGQDTQGRHQGGCPQRARLRSRFAMPAFT